jgi:hypothetical protein
MFSLTKAQPAHSIHTALAVSLLTACALGAPAAEAQSDFDYITDEGASADTGYLGGFSEPTDTGAPADAWYMEDFFWAPAEDRCIIDEASLEIRFPERIVSTDETVVVHVTGAVFEGGCSLRADVDAGPENTAGNDIDVPEGDHRFSASFAIELEQDGIDALAVMVSLEDAYTLPWVQTHVLSVQDDGEGSSRIQVEVLADTADWLEGSLVCTRSCMDDSGIYTFATEVYADPSWGWAATELELPSCSYAPVVCGFAPADEDMLLAANQNGSAVGVDGEISGLAPSAQALLHAAANAETDVMLPREVAAHIQRFRAIGVGTEEERFIRDEFDKDVFASIRTAISGNLLTETFGIPKDARGVAGETINRSLQAITGSKAAAAAFNNGGMPNDSRRKDGESLTRRLLGTSSVLGSKVTIPSNGSSSGSVPMDRSSEIGAKTNTKSGKSSSSSQAKVDKAVTLTCIIVGGLCELVPVATPTTTTVKAVTCVVAWGLCSGYAIYRTVPSSSGTGTSGGSGGGGGTFGPLHYTTVQPGGPGDDGGGGEDAPSIGSAGNGLVQLCGRGATPNTTPSLPYGTTAPRMALGSASSGTPDDTNTTPGTSSAPDWCFDGRFSLSSAVTLLCRSGSTIDGKCTQERSITKTEMRRQMQLSCGGDDHPCPGSAGNPRL